MADENSVNQISQYETSTSYVDKIDAGMSRRRRERNNNGTSPSSSAYTRYNIPDIYNQEDFTELFLTEPTWRESLRNIIGISRCITEQSLRAVVVFLLETFSEALHVQSNYGHNSTVQIPLPLHKKPKVLDIDSWKSLMIAIGFELEEPCSHRGLDLVSVNGGPHVDMKSLRCVIALLQSVLRTDYRVLRPLLTIDSHQVFHFTSAISRILAGEHDVTDCILQFWDSHGDFYKSIGIVKEKHHGKSYRVICKTRDSSFFYCIQIVLLGLYGNRVRETVV